MASMAARVFFCRPGSMMRSEALTGSLIAAGGVVAAGAGDEVPVWATALVRHATNSKAVKANFTKASWKKRKKGIYENNAENASVITTHHPTTMANDVPIFTLPAVANPIAVNASVQSKNRSTCEAMKYQNGLSAAFMKYPGLEAIGLFSVNPSALAPASTETIATRLLSIIGNPAYATTASDLP